MSASSFQFSMAHETGAAQQRGSEPFDKLRTPPRAEAAVPLHRRIPPAPGRPKLADGPHGGQRSYAKRASVGARVWGSGVSRTGGVLLSLWLAGCSVLPQPPAQSLRYDFGPELPAVPITSADPAAQRPPIALADVQAPGLKDADTSVLYRLAYADAQVIRPYQLARWTLPPAQLVQQRLSRRLAWDRSVLNGSAAALQPRVQGQLPALLQIELEEFSHVFRSAEDSAGWVRLRATLVERQPQGELLLGQRTFTAQQAADSATAAGGVRALTQATDQAIAALQLWLAQLGR